MTAANFSSPETLHISPHALLTDDFEFNGQVNRATHQGAKFALLMAMLEQDCLQRPQLETSEQNTQAKSAELEVNYYRPYPLSANDTYWHTCQHTSQLIHAGKLESAHLWLAMFPEPLSLKNQADDIDDEVIANCSINTQSRMQQAKQTKVKVDETGLYDILQGLQSARA